MVYYGFWLVSMVIQGGFMVFELVQQAAADLESQQAAHEAWVASLIPPPETSVTAHEAERAAMINRRRHFMATLMDQPLTEETLAAARAANIFIG